MTIRLPTQAEFLQTGWETCSPASLPPPETVCSICTDECVGQVEVVRLKICGHYFHKEGCLLPWITGIRPGRNSCPNCRHILYQKNDLTVEQIAILAAEADDSIWDAVEVPEIESLANNETLRSQHILTPQQISTLTGGEGNRYFHWMVILEEADFAQGLVVMGPVPIGNTNLDDRIDQLHRELRTNQATAAEVQAEIDYWGLMLEETRSLGEPSFVLGVEHHLRVLEIAQNLVELLENSLMVRIHNNLVYRNHLQAQGVSTPGEDRQAGVFTGPLFHRALPLPASAYENVLEILCAQIHELRETLLTRDRVVEARQLVTAQLRENIADYHRQGCARTEFDAETATSRVERLDSIGRELVNSEVEDRECLNALVGARDGVRHAQRAYLIERAHHMESASSSGSQ